MTRYYIQIMATITEGYDEADTYEEILALAIKYKHEEQAKHPHLGKMWFDIERVEDEV